MLDDGTSHIHTGAKPEMSYCTPVCGFLGMHGNLQMNLFLVDKNLDNLADNQVNK